MAMSEVEIWVRDVFKEYGWRCFYPASGNTPFTEVAFEKLAETGKIIKEVQVYCEEGHIVWAGKYADWAEILKNKEYVECRECESYIIRMYEETGESPMDYYYEKIVFVMDKEWEKTLQRDNRHCGTCTCYAKT